MAETFPVAVTVDNVRELAHTLVLSVDNVKILLAVPGPRLGSAWPNAKNWYLSAVRLP